MGIGAEVSICHQEMGLGPDKIRMGMACGVQGRFYPEEVILKFKILPLKLHSLRVCPSGKVVSSVWGGKEFTS